jgi:hypothetical protein
MSDKKLEELEKQVEKFKDKLWELTESYFGPSVQYDMFIEPNIKTDIRILIAKRNDPDNDANIH